MKKLGVILILLSLSRFLFCQTLILNDEPVMISSMSPSILGALQVPVNPSTANISLSWTAPTTFANGAPLPPGYKLTYNIYRGVKPDGSGAVKLNGTDIIGTSYTVTGNAIGVIHYFAVSAKGQSGLESAKTAPIMVDLANLPAAPGQFKLVIVAIP